MTEPSEPERGVAAAIRAIRHDILSNGRDVSWDDIREWIRGLVKHARPSSQERIQLLELYNMAAALAQRRLRPDPEASQRLGYQRANDTVLFLVAEIRDLSGADPKGAIAAIVEREQAAGRMHMDSFLGNLISWVLQECDHRRVLPPSGVREEPADFSSQPRVSPSPSSRGIPL